jgi:hypothetical protein
VPKTRLDLLQRGDGHDGVSAPRDAVPAAVCMAIPASAILESDDPGRPAPEHGRACR